ncbi:DUF7159 family protein [Mycobacterium botniense]|uniref:DUF7159 domain-containing protein n=1 Tax=Mycobacterium botniense TaxID=84962 RepID=A0A7I9Y1H8_9MYCO|nr:hypothetical protein [Mycobacterium botniense]GFG75919.1 hypothetical protein MBOT_32840 [Mycobacterium botniense]
MDTVLGLSMTSTTVGWVLVEGSDANGSILDHGEFGVCTGGGGRAVKTAKQVTAAVLRAHNVATTHGYLLSVIGVTWNNDVAAEAALLLESLTGAGFDNVVPVQSLQAVETLARAITPVIGYEQTAMCVLERDSATVVLVDSCEPPTQTAVRQLGNGRDKLIRWLTTMFDRGRWHPAAIVLVGSEPELETISWQLEKVLPVPVFAQTTAQLAVARGAALAASRSTEFIEVQLPKVGAERGAQPVRSASYSGYRGALATLAAGAVTLVASVSLVAGLRLTPDRALGAVQQAAHPSPQGIAPVAPPAPHAQAPRVTTPSPPPPVAPPVAAPASQPEPDPVREPSADIPADEALTPAPQQQPSVPPPQSDSRAPLLTRVLEHIQGWHRDPPPAPPPLQAQPGQPPNPGVPSP